MRHVALIGLSGAGKSTVGRQLAAELGVPWVDTDREVERAAGLPVHRIFTELGEVEFRRLEAHQVRLALEGPPSVISLGGGAVIDWANRGPIWERAVVVWLRAAPEVLARRLQAGTDAEIRPLLHGGDPSARLAALLASREPVYSAAHLSLDTTNQRPEQVIAELLPSLRLQNLD